MDVQAKMNLPLHRLFFSTSYLPIDGPLEEKKEMGQLSPRTRLLLDCLYLDFFLFQMGESNEDIEQMFSNLLGEMDLLTQVINSPSYLSN